MGELGEDRGVVDGGKAVTDREAGRAAVFTFTYKGHDLLEGAFALVSRLATAGLCAFLDRGVLVVAEEGMDEACVVSGGPLCEAEVQLAPNTSARRSVRQSG